MSQPAMQNPFRDEPFFSLSGEALSSLQSHFQQAHSLLKELHQGPHRELLHSPFPFRLGSEGPTAELHHEALLRSPFSSRLGSEGPTAELHAGALLRSPFSPRLGSEGPTAELHEGAERGPGDCKNFLLTLDVRGYGPDDLTVKLEGRSLTVVAMKQAGAEEAKSCSTSPSSSFSSSSSSSAQRGFVRRIDLPAHLDLARLSCSLMDNGQLRIHAPAAKQPISEEREVPMRFRTSLDIKMGKEDGDTVTKTES